MTMPALGVQLVNKPASPRTGIGRYAAELERGLLAEGVDVTVASVRRPMPAVVAALARRAGYDLDTFFQSYPLRAEVAANRMTHLTSQTLGLLLLTQRLPRPVVVTVHDILPYLLRHDPALSVYRNSAQRLIDALAMRGLRRADRLIADSHYTMEAVIRELGIARERIAVVHLGVDAARFRRRPVPDAFRERYGLQGAGPYLLYVGSEDPRKQLPTLLRAVAQLRHGFPDTQLLKVGKAAFSEQRAQHLRLCGELGIADGVRWLDDVPEDDLPLFYNLADVFAFPSRYEGFGFPVLEALACGTPVVAARASSIPELVGDAALLIEDNSAEAFAAGLIHVLANTAPDPTWLAGHAARWSWSTTIAGTRSIYEELAGGRLPAVSGGVETAMVPAGLEQGARR